MSQAPDALPHVGCVPTKRQKGAATLGDKVSPMSVRPFREAFGEKWTTDAHFSCYEVRQGSQRLPQWPRLKKVVLDQIEEKGGSVALTMLVIDYDSKDNVAGETLTKKADAEGKVPWDEELIEEFWPRVDRAIDEHGLPMPNVIYTTTNGARFVYVLSEPIDVRIAEDYHRGLVHAFGKAGLIADPTCSDWTRLFRLPFVTRDGKKTWESPFSRMMEQFETFIGKDDIEPVEKPFASSGPTGVVKEITRPAPTREVALRMLEVQMPGNRGVRQSGAFKEAKRRLRGRNCYPCIFDMAPIARHGSRDSTLTSYVGEAVAMLYGVDTITPEFVYALFMPSVEQLDPDDGTPDWLAKLWYLVCYTWAREEARAQAQDAKQRVEVKQKQSQLDEMLANFRRWCDAPELDQDDNRAKLWMLQHSIAMTRSRTYHLLTPSGFYTRHGMPKDHLLQGMRQYGLSEFLEVEEMDKGGEPKLMPMTKILGLYGTQVHEVRGAANWPGSTIQNIGSEDARLVICLYRLREELGAEYNEQVDRWLTKLVGEENVQALRDWIGFALDFQGGPICALSLAGPNGAGKKMIARGLAECINTEMVCPASQLTSDHPHDLLKTPFLVADEGLPQTSGRGMDIADLFRSAVAGETLTVNMKYGELVTISSPLRVLFLANNMDLVNKLTAHRVLTPEDQRALAQRIYHLPVRQECSDWLAANGGKHGMTKGWIASDAGGGSDYVVARHFLWLYENRPKQPLGSRFLMEGNLDGQIMREMRTQTGIAPLVIRTIISMVESPGGHNQQGVSIQDGRVYVTAHGIVESYKADFTANRRDMNTKQVGTVLKGLVVQGSPTGSTWRVLPNGQRLKARWHELDITILYEEAQVAGFPSKRLSELIDEQFGEEAQAVREAIEESL